MNGGPQAKIVDDAQTRKDLSKDVLFLARNDYIPTATNAIFSILSPLLYIPHPPPPPVVFLFTFLRFVFVAVLPPDWKPKYRNFGEFMVSEVGGKTFALDESVVRPGSKKAQEKKSALWLPGDEDDLF